MSFLNLFVNSVVIFNNDALKDEMKMDTDYEFLVRLTHVSTGESVDLGKLNLNLHKSQLTTWCKDFYEFKYIIKIPYVFLPNGVGSYALKLLVREETAPKWTVQTISKIVVKVCI